MPEKNEQKKKLTLRICHFNQDMVNSLSSGT